MITKRFRIYEIEHQGDESHALSQLTKAGCTNIRVIGRDFDEDESILVECRVPDEVNLNDYDLCL